MKKNYRIDDSANAQLIIQLLEDKIYEHNSSKISKNDGRLFCRIIRDEDENIIAGIAGWTWAGACEITQLWVDETARKNGIGQMLLETAEEEARNEGCISVLVKTYSFQAPGFYERHGYVMQLSMNHFPKGYSYCILLKNIGAKI